MKVGTDGVLLGAWTNVTDVKNILDIGTGSGLIALMLAQRTENNIHIDAVEIDTLAASEALENFIASPWRDKTSIHQMPIQNFLSEKKYDLIVSNPPYFINSFKPPAVNRLMARHTENLSFHDLLEATKKLLSETGRLSVILPIVEGEQFITLASLTNLKLTRKWTFRTRAEKPVERYLLEFSMTPDRVFDTGEIRLYDSGENWSDEYKQLTRDFYLKI